LPVVSLRPPVAFNPRPRCLSTPPDAFELHHRYLTAAAYAVLVARKDTTSPLACVCLAAVVNVLGDYVAVAVYGGGSVGAAWATTAALYAGCGAFKSESFRFSPTSRFQ
jgi:Na+-driven multidrug efflux pump